MPKTLVTDHVATAPDTPTASPPQGVLYRLADWWTRDETILWNRRVGAGLLLTAGATMFGGVAFAWPLLLVIGAVVAIRVLSARFPQATGSVLALVATLMMWLMFAGMIGVDMALRGSHDLGAGFAIGAVGLFSLVWINGNRNCHRGWSTVVALLPLWAGMFTAAAWPQHSGAVAAASVLAGLAALVWRLRGAPQGQPQRRSRLRRLVVRSAAIAGALMMLLGVGALAAPPSAHAQFGWVSGMMDDTKCSMVRPDLNPMPVGTGPEGWFPNRNFAKVPAENPTEGAVNPPEFMDQSMAFGDNLDAFTLYEVSGLRGIRFVNWSYTASGGNACSMSAGLSRMAGNGVNTLGLSVLQGVIALKEYSQTQNPFAAFYPHLTPVMESFMTMTASAMGALSVIAVIAFAVRGVRGGRIQEAGGKVIGGLVAAFLYGVVYNGSILVGSIENPGNSIAYHAMNGADSMVGTLNAAFADMALGAVPNAESSMCKKPDGSGDSMEDGQRYSSCLMAEVMAYRPWAMATFGPSGASVIEPNVQPVSGDWNQQDAEPKALPCYNNYEGCADLRSYIPAQIGGPGINQEVARCLSDNGYTAPEDDEDDEGPEIDALRVCEPYHAVAEDLYEKRNQGDGPHVDTILSYQGVAGGHGFQSLFILVASVVVGGSIGIIAVATILAHLQALWLFVTGWVYFLGAWVRGFETVQKWASSLFQAYLLRFFYGIAVTAIVLAVSIVAVLPVAAGFRMLMLAMIVMVTIKSLRKIDSAATVGNADPSKFGTVATGAAGAVGGLAAYKGGGALMRATGSGVSKGGALAVAGVGKAGKAAAPVVGRATAPAREAGAKAGRAAQIARAAAGNKVQYAAGRVTSSVGNAADQVAFRATHHRGGTDGTGPSPNALGRTVANLQEKASARASDRAAREPRPTIDERLDNAASRVATGESPYQRGRMASKVIHRERQATADMPDKEAQAARRTQARESTKKMSAAEMADIAYADNPAKRDRVQDKLNVSNMGAAAREEHLLNTGKGPGDKDDRSLRDKVAEARRQARQQAADQKARERRRRTTNSDHRNDIG